MIRKKKKFFFHYKQIRCLAIGKRGTLLRHPASWMGWRGQTQMPGEGTQNRFSFLYVGVLCPIFLLGMVHVCNAAILGFVPTVMLQKKKKKGFVINPWTFE